MRYIDDLIANTDDGWQTRPTSVVVFTHLTEESLFLNDINANAQLCSTAAQTHLGASLKQKSVCGGFVNTIPCNRFDITC